MERGNEELLRFLRQSNPISLNFNQDTQQSPQYNYSCFAIKNKAQLKSSKKYSRSKSKQLQQSVFDPYKTTKFQKRKHYHSKGHLQDPARGRSQSVCSQQQQQYQQQQQQKNQLQEYTENSSSQASNQGQFEVEAIVGRRRKKNRLQYKVLWKGFSWEQSTWESYQTVQHLGQMIEQFESCLRQIKRPKSKHKKRKHHHHHHHRNHKQKIEFQPDDLKRFYWKKLEKYNTNNHGSARQDGIQEHHHSLHYGPELQSLYNSTDPTRYYMQQKDQLQYDNGLSKRDLKQTVHRKHFKNSEKISLPESIMHKQYSEDIKKNQSQSVQIIQRPSSGKISQEKDQQPLSQALEPSHNNQKSIIQNIDKICLSVGKNKKQDQKMLDQNPLCLKSSNSFGYTSELRQKEQFQKYVTASPEEVITWDQPKDDDACPNIVTLTQQDVNNNNVENNGNSGIQVINYANDDLLKNRKNLKSQYEEDQGYDGGEQNTNSNIFDYVSPRKKTTFQKNVNEQEYSEIVYNLLSSQNEADDVKGFKNIEITVPLFQEQQLQQKIILNETDRFQVYQSQDEQRHLDQVDNEIQYFQDQKCDDQQQHAQQDANCNRDQNNLQNDYQQQQDKKKQYQMQQQQQSQLQQAQPQKLDQTIQQKEQMKKQNEGLTEHQQIQNFQKIFDFQSCRSFIPQENGQITIQRAPETTTKNQKKEPKIQSNKVINQSQIRSEEQLPQTKHQKAQPNNQKLKTEKSSQQTILSQSTYVSNYKEEWNDEFTFAVTGFLSVEKDLYCRVKWARKFQDQKGNESEEKDKNVQSNNSSKLPRYIKKQEVLGRFPMRLLEFYDKNCYLIPRKS